MQLRLSRYKTDRMWNINANIVLADIVSTAATALLIEAIQAKLPTPLSIVMVTAVIDGAISLAAFAYLHTCVNRDRGVKDLARVQVHRWVLSPLHYLVGSGIQYGLLAMACALASGCWWLTGARSQSRGLSTPSTGEGTDCFTKSKEPRL